MAMEPEQQGVASAEKSTGMAGNRLANMARTAAEHSGGSAGGEHRVVEWTEAGGGFGIDEPVVPSPVIGR